MSAINIAASIGIAIMLIAAVVVMLRAWLDFDWDREAEWKKIDNKFDRRLK